MAKKKQSRNLSDELIPKERVTQLIYLIRGQKVMLDRDLAQLYQVETRVLNQAVTRNLKRFPDDFMFELTRDEIRNISQTVICSETLKHARNVRCFTEQGVAMNELLSLPEPEKKRSDSVEGDTGEVHPPQSEKTRY